MLCRGSHRTPVDESTGSAATAPSRAPFLAVGLHEDPPERWMQPGTPPMTSW
jgi:hypothetical protein